MKRITVLILLIANNTQAEQTFSFKSPAFSGIGYSSHVQTIENTETTRKQALQAKKLQAIEEAEDAAKNTTLQKFLNNFESRVYAQLSTQLINNLFGENPKNSGTVTIEGNTITYLKSADQITMSIVDDRGNTTDVTVPIGSFTF
tara:strand:+ start:346 stop:780 length:435 start_codon:yes stop_codon:yes gene_type:complete